jgi:hypothetical protein
MTCASGLIAPKQSCIAAIAAALFPLSQEALFNFCVHLVEPLFRTLGSIAIRLCFSLQLGNAVLGRAQLVRELLRHLERVSAILLRHPSRLVQQTKDRLPRFVELITAVGAGASLCWCERNYGFL